MITDKDSTPTRDLAEWAVGQTSHDITPNAITWAKHALLDWCGVALGGSRDPLVQILIDDALEEGEAGESRLIGRAERVIPAKAALINGWLAGYSHSRHLWRSRGGFPSSRSQCGKDRNRLRHCRDPGLGAEVHVRHHVQTPTCRACIHERFAGCTLGGKRIYQ